MGKLPVSAKGEIGWRRTTPDGERFEVYAHRVGTVWKFFERQRRYEHWRSVPAPPLTDWLELLDALERRADRRLVPPKEPERIRQRIRELFPEAKP